MRDKVIQQHYYISEMTGIDSKRLVSSIEWSSPAPSRGSSVI